MTFCSFAYDMLYNYKKNLAKIVFLFSDHFNERCGKLTLDMIRDYVEEKNLSIQKDISEKEIDNLICKIKSLGGDVDSLSVHKFEYRLLVICVYYALYDPSGPKNKMLLINNENEIYFFHLLVICVYLLCRCM